MEKQMEYTKNRREDVMRHGWARHSLEWKTDLIVFLCLTGFAFLINRHMEIKGLYMDDLYQWTCYFDQSFFPAVFTMGGTRFRVLYNLVSWIQMKLFGPHVGWYVPFNILLNSGIAFTLYRMARRFSRSVYVGVVLSLIWLASRMSFYQIGQALGLMESMALWLAVGILYLLYGYLNEQDGKENRRFFLAAVMYVAICFVHERYMALLPLFFLVLLFRRAKEWKLWLAPLGGFAVVQLCRLVSIGTVSPAGTGGTDVADTLSVGSVLHFAMTQIAYRFGINAGPEHLNGQNFREAPLAVMLLIAVADLMLALLIVAFCIRLVQRRKKCIGYLKTVALFVFFIGACIASSSVTIRVEMRWVYVSYAAALLFLAWIYGVLTEGMAQKGRWMQAVPYLSMITVYVLLMLPVEHYYRGQFPNLYYWTDQERYNSLAEETYGQYGVGIFGKTIYIVGHQFEMDDDTEDTFFRVFDRLNRPDSTRVVHIEDVREIGLVTDDMLVIQEDPKNNRFQDVTHVVKTFKCRPIYGFYDDGWLDERAKVQVMAGSTGQINMTFNYPRDLQKDQWLTVYVNDEPQIYLNFDENTKTASIQVDPYEPVTLRFESNFYVPNALEKRGVTRLAVLFSMTAD